MDQNQGKSIICISKNPGHAEKVRAICGSANLIVTDNPVQAILRISGLSDLLFVFFESVDSGKDKSWIRHLRKNVPYTCFLVLLKEHILPEEGRLYASYGVNDIIDPGADDQLQRDRIGFMSTHVMTLMRPVKKADAVVFDYRIPFSKRLFDICFASLAILALIPVWLVVAVAIRLESKGKIIYQSKRVGTGYKVFGFYKFRSMFSDADRRLTELSGLNQYVDETNKFTPVDSVSEDHRGVKLYSDDAVIDESDYLQERKSAQTKAFVKLQNDPRVTRVGRVIRKLSIDELPQLFNVLTGDMSIVGNRPLPLYEAEKLTTDDYLERFLAPAGLTGLWQVEKRGQNSRMSPEERKQLDITYARNFNFWMDMKILFKTIPAMIQKEDV